MDNNRLKYFLVLNATESVRKAADILNISPAALSKAIKQLEFEINTTLIMPVGRGIAITEEGRMLARQVQPLMENLAKIKKAFKEKRRLDTITSRPILMGSFEVFSTHFLSSFIHYFPENCDLLLQRILPGEMERALLAGEIDYGITYVAIPTTGIIHKKVALAEMKIFGLANLFEKIPFAEIPFVVPAHPLAGIPNKIQGIDGWPDGQVERLIKYRVSMVESALELCRQGKAVAYLPSLVVYYHNKTVKTKYNLQSISFPKEMSSQKQPVYLLKRKSDLNDKVFEKIELGLQTLVQQLKFE